MRKLIIAVLVVAVVAAGVYFLRRADAPGGAPLAVGGGDAHAPLAYVPADTPYVFANLEPLPAAVTSRWMQQMDVGARLWQSQLAQGIRKLEQSRPDAEELKWLRALNAELEGKSMAQVLDSLGYDMQGRVALYGIGLVPVLRMSLADPDEFRAFIARIEQQVGAPFPTARVDTQDYWQLSGPEGKLRGVMALQDGQLVLTLAPPSDDAPLRQLLGLDKPQATMQDGGALAALNLQFGYLPHGSGYIDSRALVAQFAAPATPLESAFLTAFGIEKPAIDAVCAGEYAALAGQVPRLSFGYTRLEAERMDMVSRFETSAAIAADLKRLRAPMPGLAQAAQAPFNFGISLKLAALPGLVNTWAASVAASPWQCDSLQPLNQGFAQSREQLANPVVFGAAPVFEGLHAIATRVELKPGGAPPDFGGKLLIGSPSPAALVGMAKSFVPQLASMQLAPDGKVQALPTLPNMPPEMPAWVAMTDHVLGLAIGVGEDADLADYLTSDPTQQPLLVLGYSGELFAQFNKMMLEQAAAVADPDEQAEQRQVAEMVNQIYGQIRRAEIRIEFGDSGIEMHQSAQLN